ncbi:hypothetical protein [Reichenbachiella sp.]|uniref:hypothetical protein n=1 Tax=Reichenbachiella sp. TaxID=2184521 RepID=UPI003B58F4E0
MELKELDIRTNIKVLAWIYVIAFGILGFFSLSNIVKMLIIKKNPMQEEWLEADPNSFFEASSIASDIFAISAITLAISIILILTASELMKFRKWVAITINVVSAVFVISILSAIIFAAYQFQTSDVSYNVEHFGPEHAKYWELVKKYQMISFGTIGHPSTLMIQTSE